MADAPQGEQKQIAVKKTDDFESFYANNVRFESSAWDLKLLFGQLNQADSEPGQILVDQHTAVSMSWPEVKVFAFYLLFQIAAYQAENGTAIFLPQAVIPPRPNSADPSIVDINGRKVVEYLAWVWDQFFGAPYVPPSVENFEANWKEPRKP